MESNTSSLCCINIGVCQSISQVKEANLDLSKKLSDSRGTGQLRLQVGRSFRSFYEGLGQRQWRQQWVYGKVLKGWQEAECREKKVFRLQDFVISWVEGKIIVRYEYLVSG